jgi:methyl-accepting chemotaxis protein
MNWFYNLKISSKLICAFVLVAALAAVVGVAGIRSINTINDADTYLYEAQTVPMAATASLAKDLQRIRVDTALVLLAESPQETSKRIDKVKEVIDVVSKDLEAVKKDVVSKEAKESLAKFETARDAFVPHRDKVLALASEGKQREALALMKSDFYTTIKAAEASLNELQQDLVDEAKATSDRNDVETKHAVWTMAAIISLAAALAIALGLWLARIIGRPVKEAAQRTAQLCNLDIANLAKAIEATAAGDLSVTVEGGTQPLDVHTKDEVGALSQSINQIIQQVEHTVVSFKKAQGTLRNVIDETRILTDAALNGKLEQRGADTKYEGGYRELVKGMNSTLDAVVAPINEAQSVLEKMSNRDLTVRINGDYKGDFAKIKTALNDTLESLERSFSQVATGSQQVASASGQISSGSQSLAQGASEQASSLEEVSSSLQEMASMTKQNAANAREARALSDSTCQSSTQCTERMNDLTGAIGKIKASADATAKIVKTIDEIAFQTNLLALNAAVEAARAGDAGKGFAVVAEEVRNLAMRSADAAKQTTNLIEESVSNAEGGVTLNKQVLESLSGINAKIQKVTEVVAEIAAASEQQSQGIDQINTAVDQMNQVTQQVAANSEESAAAAEELSGQAQEMDSVIGSFKLTGTSSRSTKRVHTPATRPASRLTAVPHKPRPVTRTAEELIPFDDSSSEDVAVLASF